MYRMLVCGKLQVVEKERNPRRENLENQKNQKEKIKNLESKNSFKLLKEL